jgi:hypothetical protein
MKKDKISDDILSTQEFMYNKPKNILNEKTIRFRLFNKIFIFTLSIKPVPPKHRVFQHIENPYIKDHNSLIEYNKETPNLNKNGSNI